MPYFLLLDLETTGLNPETCAIIEVAAQLLGGTGAVPEAFCRMVTPPFWKSMKRWEERALEMHRESGLLALAITEGDPVEPVDTALANWIKQHCQDQDVHLMGNSVHFDREFLRWHMPKTFSCLHYRQLDVTSVRLFIQLMTGKDPLTYKKKRAHTAPEDIRETLKEAQHYYRGM